MNCQVRSTVQPGLPKVLSSNKKNPGWDWGSRGGLPAFKTLSSSQSWAPNSDNNCASAPQTFASQSSQETHQQLSGDHLAEWLLAKSEKDSLTMSTLPAFNEIRATLSTEPAPLARKFLLSVHFFCTCRRNNLPLRVVGVGNVRERSVKKLWGQRRRS